MEMFEYSNIPPVELKTNEILQPFEHEDLEIILLISELFKLIFDSYRLEYVANKYKKRYYYLNLTNNSLNPIDLYLLSLTNSTDITIQIKDESGNLLEDVTLNLKRYYVTSNSYLTVAMAKTDVEGEAIFDVDFDDAFYEFFATYGDFSTKTTGSKIFKTPITIRINTQSSPFAKLDSITRIRSNISFNNLTQTFSYFFSDEDGNTRTGTLEVLRGSTVVCNTTASSSSATLLCKYNLTNETSRIYAVGYIDGSKIPTAIIEEASAFIQEAKALFGRSGLFYTALFAGSVAALGVFSPAVSVIMFLVGLGAMMFMGINLISTIVYILIVIIGLMVVWRLKS